MHGQSNLYALLFGSSDDIFMPHSESWGIDVCPHHGSFINQCILRGSSLKRNFFLN